MQDQAQRLPQQSKGPPGEAAAGRRPKAPSLNMAEEPETRSDASPMDVVRGAGMQAFRMHHVHVCFFLCSDASEMYFDVASVFVKIC